MFEKDVTPRLYPECVAHDIREECEACEGPIYRALRRYGTIGLSLSPNTVKIDLPDGSEAWYYLETPSSSLT